MILIADSGATKTDWCFGTTLHDCQLVHTEGINPFHLTEEKIKQILQESLLAQLPFPQEEVKAVFFYGAGCTPEKAGKLSGLLAEVFSYASIQVESDLLGAARALCKHQPGIACILGTGANSCLYDGQRITHNTPPLGYILGDEGSGAVLGKLFLADLLKGLAPKELANEFHEKFRISVNDVMESVYNLPFPNRFLGTIAYFLGDYMDNEYVYNLLTNNLRSFFNRNVCQYDYINYPIRFVGSLAYAYPDILQEVAQEFGVEIDVIEETPMNGLIEFHSMNIEES